MLGGSICQASNFVHHMSQSQAAGETTEGEKAAEVAAEGGTQTLSPCPHPQHKH
jgi:hypothetical protein